MSTAETAALVFAVNLLVGGAAIAVGAKVALRSEGYSYAVVTALLGAIAWAVVGAVGSTLGVSGLVSSVVALVVWLSVIRWRYEVGWLRGGLIGFSAWFVALAVLAVLSLLGVSALDAYGVPGV